MRLVRIRRRVLREASQERFATVCDHKESPNGYAPQNKGCFIGMENNTRGVMIPNFTGLFPDSELKMAPNGNIFV